jgi:hypothetical protein
MADTKLSALTADASPTSDDLVYVVNDPGGTPASRKVTLANVKTLMSASPTLVTPTLGVASATSINKVALTAPATGSTLTIADGKTLTASSSTTIAGTDGKTLTVSNSGTLAGGDAFTLAIAAGKTLTASNSGTLAGGDAFTLAIAASKTLTVSNSLTMAGTDSTTMTFPGTSATIARTDAAQTFTGAQTMTSPIINGVTHTTATAASIGYIGSPQNSQSTDYTAVIGDSGKHILHPTADNNPRTFTIPANGSVAYPVGTILTFINQINTVTIAITTDTMKLAGAGTTGSRTLAANGIATAVKLDSTNWIISGTGLT